MSPRQQVKLFELEMLGDAIERRYRKQRPEIETMPWGTFDTVGLDPNAVILARKAWTLASFHEHRTGIACTAALRALFECRAPVDLIALAARFPLDELAHVEMCARVAMELGGGTEIQQDTDELIVDAPPALSPLMRAGDTDRAFLLRRRGAEHPAAARHVEGCTAPAPPCGAGSDSEGRGGARDVRVRVLDWAAPRLSDEDRAHLGNAADRAIRAVKSQWVTMVQSRNRAYDQRVGDALGWMQTDAYMDAAERARARARARAAASSRYSHPGVTPSARGARYACNDGRRATARRSS